MSYRGVGRKKCVAGSTFLGDCACFRRGSGRVRRRAVGEKLCLDCEVCASDCDPRPGRATRHGRTRRTRERTWSPLRHLLPGSGIRFAASVGHELDGWPFREPLIKSVLRGFSRPPRTPLTGFPATHFFRPTPRRTSPTFSGLPAARPTASAWRTERERAVERAAGWGGERGRCPTGCRTEKVCGGIDLATISRPRQFSCSPRSSSWSQGSRPSIPSRSKRSCPRKRPTGRPSQARPPKRKQRQQRLRCSPNPKLPPTCLAAGEDWGHSALWDPHFTSSRPILHPLGAIVKSGVRRVGHAAALPSCLSSATSMPSANATPPRHRGLSMRHRRPGLWDELFVCRETLAKAPSRKEKRVAGRSANARSSGPRGWGESVGDVLHGV